jgi:S1-C subfamily serine protease
MSVHPTIKLVARAGLGVSVLLAALGATGAVASATGSAGAGSGGAGSALTARQIADYDRPAVDLVKVNTTATLNVYSPQLDINAMVAFANQDSTIQQAVQNSDDATIEEALLQEIDNNPAKYLSKGQVTTYNAQVGAQGSAFTVTPDGYLVTNAHVATVDPAELTSGFLSNLPPQEADTLTQAFSEQFAGINDASGAALAVPGDAGQTVSDIIAKFLTATANSTDIHNTVTVYEGMSSANNNAGMVARVVVAGQGFPGKDVAILKVDANNLPTVPMGDDTLLHDLDQVYAIGYPGAATFDPNVIKTTNYQSTVTEGVVSNRLQSSAANYQYIEHTATTNHGNSGGALINGQGQVVGITTAGDTSSESTPVDNGGLLFYAVPSSVIEQFLHQAGVTPSMSPAQKLYEQATDLLATGHAAAAYAKLLKAQALGFNTPYLQQEVAATGCPQAADCQTRSHASGSQVAGGGVALVVVLLLVGAVVVRSRRGTNAGSSPSVAANPVTVPVSAGPLSAAPAEESSWWADSAPRPTPPRLSDTPVATGSVPSGRRLVALSPSRHPPLA